MSGWVEEEQLFIWLIPMPGVVYHFIGSPDNLPPGVRGWGDGG